MLLEPAKLHEHPPPWTLPVGAASATFPAVPPLAMTSGPPSEGPPSGPEVLPPPDAPPLDVPESIPPAPAGAPPPPAAPPCPPSPASGGDVGTTVTPSDCTSGERVFPCTARTTAKYVVPTVRDIGMFNSVAAP